MIPKLIHHVWPGEDPFRPELHRFRQSWMQHHPDWSFRFWRTDLGDGVSGEVRALLADPRYSVVVKSDVARFELLRVHGGIYVDSDLECLRPFDDFLKSPSLRWSLEEKRAGRPELEKSPVNCILIIMIIITIFYRLIGIHPRFHYMR